MGVGLVSRISTTRISNNPTIRRPGFLSSCRSAGRRFPRRALTKAVCLAVVLLLCLPACARFQPTQPAVSASDYSAAGMQQSFTMSDSSTRYDPKVLEVGASRSSVLAAYGDPNGSRTTDSGLIEDAYAFNPDGTKFVNPQLRARNFALGFFTMGASVGVRQARLALKERKLTLFHVTYSPDDKIQMVNMEKLSGAPDQLPAPTEGTSSQ